MLSAIELQQELDANPKWIERAIVVLYERQTADEKATKSAANRRLQNSSPSWRRRSMTMFKIDRSKMRLGEPGQMQIVDVAEAFKFSAAQYPTDRSSDEYPGREGDWYFYSDKFFISFCGDHWTVQDINRPHPDPINAGCDYIELKSGRGAADLKKALSELIPSTAKVCSNCEHGITAHYCNPNSPRKCTICGCDQPFARE